MNSRLASGPAQSHDHQPTRLYVGTNGLDLDVVALLVTIALERVAWQGSRGGHRGDMGEPSANLSEVEIIIDPATISARDGAIVYDSDASRYGAYQSGDEFATMYAFSCTCCGTPFLAADHAQDPFLKRIVDELAGGEILTPLDPNEPGAVLAVAGLCTGCFPSRRSERPSDFRPFLSYSLATKPFFGN